MLPLACEGGVGVVVVGGGWWWGGPWRPSHGDRGGVRGGAGCGVEVRSGSPQPQGKGRSISQPVNQSGGIFDEEPAPSRREKKPRRSLPPPKTPPPPFHRRDVSTGKEGMCAMPLWFPGERGSHPPRRHSAEREPSHMQSQASQAFPAG